MNQPNNIRIVIADDHPLVRIGLRAVIETQADLRVIAEAADGATALTAIEQAQPDIAILDVNMPGLSGFELLRQLGARKLPVAAIFLTIHSDAVLFNEALDLGARGYVLKESAVTDIVNSIRAVHLAHPQVAISMKGFEFAIGRIGNGELATAFDARHSSSPHTVFLWPARAGDRCFSGLARRNVVAVQLAVALIFKGLATINPSYLQRAQLD
jgi:CheY-like chemotaxis protein